MIEHRYRPVNPIAAVGNPQRSAILVVGLIIACVTLNGCSSSAANNGLADLQLVETLRIGEEENADDIIFGGISGLIAVDGTGRIFVGEGQDPKVYVFAANGELLEVVGRQGEGPGEFNGLQEVHAGPGDSLYVFDYAFDRISVFEPESFDLAYTFRVSRDSLSNPSDLIGVVDTGLLFYYSVPFYLKPDHTEEGTQVLIVNWSGHPVAKPLTTLPSVETHIYPTQRGTLRSLAIPFARRPVLRMGPDQTVYAGWNESIDITITAADGSHRGSITLDREPVPVTRNEIEEWLAGKSAEYRKQVMDFGPHDTKPAYGTFLVDDLGRVWVRTTKDDMQKGVHWLVVDTESRIQAEVTVSPLVSLHVIRAGRAYAVDRTEGLELVVYDIVE